MRVGDITGAVRLDRQDVPLGIPAGHKHVFAVVDHRRDKLLGRPVHDPVPLAVARVVARHRQTAGEDHLRTATDLADDRRDVAARPVFTQRPPAFPAGLAVECDNVGIPIVVAVDNHEVLKQNRAGVEAMRAHEVADIGFPFLIPMEIVGRDDNLPR